MDQQFQLLSAWSDVLQLCAKQRTVTASSKASTASSDSRTTRVARKFRRAVTASITELDADLLEDLMRVIKKIGKGTVKDDNGFDNLLKMTFQLMEQAVSKGTPRTPDHLIWLFAKLYQGLKGVLAADLMANQTQGGGIA